MSASRMSPLLRTVSRSFAASSKQNVLAARNGARVGGRRAFASEAPKGGSNTLLYVALGTAVIGGGAYYYYGSGKTPTEIAKEVQTLGKSAAASTEATLGLRRGKEDYQKVYNAIADILDVDDYDDGSLAPVLIRLAWHSSGTFDKESGTGGSNFATMRFKPEAEHGANNGLGVARDAMEKIKAKFPWISYGDLWTLAGVCSVQETNGPKVPWRPGRIDGFEKDVTPDGRLPDGSKAQDHLRHIFYRMGFNDQEIVALSGAHAMGRCHPDRSGFDGPWTFSPTTFTNDYFKLLFDEKWQWRKWSGPAQYTDVKTKTLMMLPTDMALVKDKEFKKYAKTYADDADVFFKDFAKAFNKLIELGVPTSQWQTEPWEMKTVEEQSS